MRLEWEGLEVELPDPGKPIPVEALEAWEDDKRVAFIRAMVGPQVWAAFKRRNPDTDDLESFADAIEAAYSGAEAGESSASQGSSQNIEPPSRPTSNGSIHSTSPVSVPS